MSEGLMVAYRVESQHAYPQAVMFPRTEYRTRFECEPTLFPRAAYNAHFNREPAPMKQEAGSWRRIGAWFRRIMFRSQPTTPAAAPPVKPRRAAGHRSLRSRAASILYCGI